MHASIRERKSEGGFTLIELLVVMIIIAILMAVAVPTFLAQKNNAQKSKATANIKQIVNAIESCAANNTDGTYTGTGGGTDCTTSANIIAFEKGLRSLAPAGTADGTVLLNGTPTLNRYAVAAIGTQGYIVEGAIKDGDYTVNFAEIHREDGSLAKICVANLSPTAVTDITSTTTPAAQPNARTCTNGRWG